MSASFVILTASTGSLAATGGSVDATIAAFGFSVAAGLVLGRFSIGVNLSVNCEYCGATGCNCSWAAAGRPTGIKRPAPTRDGVSSGHLHLGA